MEDESVGKYVEKNLCWKFHEMAWMGGREIPACFAGVSKKGGDASWSWLINVCEGCGRSVVLLLLNF